MDFHYLSSNGHHTSYEFYAGRTRRLEEMKDAPGWEPGHYLVVTGMAPGEAAQLGKAFVEWTQRQYAQQRASYIQRYGMADTIEFFPPSHPAPQAIKCLEYTHDDMRWHTIPLT